MQPWMWLVVGLLLIALEVAGLGGLVLVFFGLGALLAAAGQQLHLLPQLWQQSLVAALGSLAAMAALRRRARGHGGQPAGALGGELAGEVGCALGPLAPGQVGQVMLRGSPWQAQHVGGQALADGERCVVVGVEGLTLRVRHPDV